jgi:N-acetylmuramoyl-L-alanine amidase
MILPTRYPSPNFGPRKRDRVDMLVLHYTFIDGPASLARLCDRAAEVSAHYLIEEDGRVFALVEEKMRAWHAGKSSWQGDTDVNSRSVGIELVNPGDRPFAEPQLAALIELGQGILSRHPIPAANVVGHEDVAPGRKQDPGPFFPWARLAQAGIGLWPFPDPSDQPDDAVLEAFGYDLADPPAARQAFRNHFRPSSV